MAKKEKIRIKPGIDEYLIKSQSANKVEIGDYILACAHQWMCIEPQQHLRITGLPRFFYVRKTKKGLILGFWPHPHEEMTAVITDG